MAQPQLLQVKLSRFDAQPWGFRLQGGVDFATPLVVQKVNGGSLAEKAGLIPGDAVLKINDVDVFNLRHKDAQDVVVRSGNNFVLTVQRGGSTWRPHVTPTGNIPQPQQNSPYLQTVTKTSLAHKQQESQHIGCGYNNAARPFANGGDGNVKSIVNKQYNTPVGIYSDESIAETLSAQAEVLAGGVLGVNFKKNEKEYQADKSEVLKFLREEETGASTPVFQQDHQQQHQHQQQQQHQHQHQPQPHQHYQQQQPQQHYQAPSATRHVSAPVNSPKPPSTGGLPTGQNICHECERLITGVFVRIKDKNLHVECFKCATCGTSLKNQGYYNYNNKLYCDIHAKLAALQNPPAGTDGYVPVPIKPNTKLSANTISSALNVHGFSDIPVANGGSAAAPPSAPTAQSPEGIQEIKEENADLPLPPPPSPTSLQQLGMDSAAELKQEPYSLSTSSTPSNSSSALSESHPSQIEVVVGGAIDERSSGCASTSPLNSRQASSSPSSMCGISSDNNAATLIANAPPPPPPLPPSSQQRVRQQNENDMNSQNQFESGVGGDALRGISHDSSAEQNGGGKHSPSGGVYSKFLKEYSNKLLTLNKNNNNNTHSNTNILNDDISPNINANNNNTNHSPNKQSTQIPGQVPPQSLQISDSTTFGATKTQPSQHSVVAALSSAFANQLKFNPCQQVEKPAATSAPPPPAAPAPAPASTAQATTAISSTIAINNQSSSNNNSESGQFEGATQGIHNKASDFPSAMLANPSPALGTASNDQPFGEYVTLTGSVIRSVVPPGKGANINYKVNQGYARPFGAAPVAAPKSPVAYPPQRPAVNPYATLPRTNIGQQGRRVNTYNNYTNNYSTQFKKPIASNYGSNKYATMPVYNSQYNNYYNQDSDASLQPQYAEECNSKSAPAGVEYFEEDHELAEANRQNRSNFLWPPRKEDSPIIPTAAPLYIPPPETQHVVAKPTKVSHLQKEDEVTNKQPLNEPEIKESEQEQQAKQYLRSNRQSKSAPHLTIGLQPPEIESSSESFTSTSTTTTTTSEEYQRMYAAQVQAYQMQQMYEQQSGSELDYHMDMEVATMQQNPQDSSCISSSEYICGRRSAQECVESLVAPLNTYKLIDMVREVTPSPVPPPNLQGNRHVMFIDEPETKEIPLADGEENIKSQTLASSGAISSSSTVTSSSLEGNLQADECAVNNMKTFEENRRSSETFVKTQRTEVREDQRIFQPTSEIKIEIAPVRQIPPSKIPNPVPKEWINPMVRVLTTAPDVPFHLVECPCPKPCDGNSFEPLEEDETPQETVKTEETKKNVDAKEILYVEETPTKGSWLASAITTAPEWEVRFEPPPSEMIPLPEETEPYMPPPIDMKPYLREDYRPKSPFLSALTTAPERPFEGHFERDVPIHLLDLPTPKEHLTMSDALCTAPERAYTPLNPENATNVFEEQEMEKKKKKNEFQVLNREEELGIQALDKLCTKPTNANATLPHKVNARMNRNISDAHQSDTDIQADGNATAMLTESIGLINAGDKMDNFMAEAGKIISNMLEARLANNSSTMPTSSHGGSTSSLRSNCSSNQSRSPMVIRKRFDLEDFKNIDPTVPVALKPVLTVPQQPQKTSNFEPSPISCQKTNPQMVSKKEPNSIHATDVPTSHPMGKLLGICDKNIQGRISPSQSVSTPLQTQAIETGHPIKSTQEDAVTGCQLNDIPAANQPQDVVYREKPCGPLRQCSSQREGELSTHELDRRSYIEPTDLNVSESAREGPAFSIHVRALGPKSNNSEGLSSTIMPPENEEVVSQLLRDGKRPICCQCNLEITKGPFITALGRIWCPEHFICVNANCRRPLQDIGFVEEKGDLYCEYCFEKYLAPTCCKCGIKIKGDCLNAIGKQFHPECFTCGHCGKLFGNTPFFLEDGNAYCEADWNELFTTKCFACGFPVEAGDRWVEALNHNYHSQCFNCTYCKQNLEGQSFYNKGGRPFCKNHAR